MLETPGSDFCCALGSSRAGVHAGSKHILGGVCSGRWMDTRVGIYCQTFFYFWLSNHLSWSDAEQGSRTRPFLRPCSLTVGLTCLVEHREKGEWAGTPQVHTVFANCGVCSVTAASCLMLIQRITEITWMAVLYCIAKLFISPPYCVKFCITGNEVFMLSAKDKKAPKWVHYCSFFFFLFRNMLNGVCSAFPLY